MIRTSLNHPLHIAEVPAAGGVIGMTLCPGKKGVSFYGAPWNRDLSLDMKAIAGWQPAIVITLMEHQEFVECGVPDLPQAMTGLGIPWVHLPIRDVDVPAESFERRWAEVGPTVEAALKRGGRVLVHCRGGLARTGLVSARVLIELGAPPERAIFIVRSARPGAIETSEQLDYVRNCSRSGGGDAREPEIPQSRQRFMGCLLGGAVGDALGAPVEFMTRRQIQGRYGREGITGFAPAYGDLGTITDDTQLTLFTAEGLIQTWVSGMTQGFAGHCEIVARAYLRWLRTQGYSPRHASANEGVGWLIKERRLHSSRAPGTTCLSALRAVAMVGAPADNDSKGCGGVMRMAPVGLYASRLRGRFTPSETFRLGKELAALTHGHPSGSLPAGVLAVLIQELADGASLREALIVGKSMLRRESGHEETLRGVEAAEALAASDTPSDEAIARLGEGWVGDEALAIAIYCALIARDFRHGVVLAVNHDGDSDSTGSIAGNLLGTLHGVNAIPAEWLQPLELREVISELAADLHAIEDGDFHKQATAERAESGAWRKYA